MFLIENSLYTTQSEYDDFIKDKEQVANALLFNFFGFISLFAAAPRKDVKLWKTVEKQVRLDNIGDENTDVSISVKMAYDAGMIPRSTADKFTKLLALFKQGKIVKNTDIDDDLMLDLFKLAKFDTVNKPSSQLRAAVQSYIDRDINIAFLAKEIYRYARLPDIAKVNQEFFKMYKSGMYLQVYSALLTGLAGLKMGVPQHMVKTITNKTIIHKKTIDPTGITQVVDAIEDIKDDFLEPAAKKQPPEVKNLDKVEKQIKKTTKEIEPDEANIQELPKHVVEPEPIPEPSEPEFDPHSDQSDTEIKVIKPKPEYMKIVGFNSYRNIDKICSELKTAGVSFKEAFESEDAFIKLFLQMFGNQLVNDKSSNPIADVNAFYMLAYKFADSEGLTIPEWVVPAAEMEVYGYVKYKKDDGLYQSLVAIKTSYGMLNYSGGEVIYAFDRFSGVKSLIGGGKKIQEKTTARVKKYGAKLNISDVYKSINLRYTISELIRELFINTSFLRIMYGDSVKVDSRFNFLLNLVEFELKDIENSYGKKFTDKYIADFNPRPATIEWLRENLTPLQETDYFIFNDNSTPAFRFVSVKTQVKNDVESVINGNLGTGFKLTFHSDLLNLFKDVRLFYLSQLIINMPKITFDIYSADYIAECGVNQYGAGDLINNLIGNLRSDQVKEVLAAICSDLADHGSASKFCKSMDGKLSKVMLVVGSVIEQLIGTEKYQKLVANEFAVNGMGDANFFTESTDEYIKDKAEIYKDNIFQVQANVESHLAELFDEYQEYVKAGKTGDAKQYAFYLNSLVGKVKSHYATIKENSIYNIDVDSSFVNKYIVMELPHDYIAPPPSVLKVIFDEYARVGKHEEIDRYIDTVNVGKNAADYGSDELIESYPKLIADLHVDLKGDHLYIGRNMMSSENKNAIKFVTAYFKTLLKDPEMVKLNSDGLVNSLDDVEPILLKSIVKMNSDITSMLSPELLEQVKLDISNIKPNDIAKNIVDVFNGDGDVNQNIKMLCSIQIVGSKPHIFDDNTIESILDIPYGSGADSASKLGSKIKDNIAIKMYDAMTISEIGSRSPKVKGAILGSKAIDSFDDVAMQNIDMVKSVIENSGFEMQSNIPNNDVLLKIAKVNGIGLSGFKTIDLDDYDSKEAFEADYSNVLTQSFINDLTNSDAMPIDEAIVDEKSLHEESLKLHNTSNGRHGDVAPIIKKKFKINMDRSKLEAFVERDALNPNSTSKGNVETYMFHGTGSIATAFITKFGFRELPQNLGLFVTGKMLGEGIYLAKNIDKSLSYIGDDGFNKQYRKGYVFVADVCLGEKNVDYRDDEGGTLSQEWCIKNFEHQLVITDIYEVESTSRYDFRQYDNEQKAKREKEKEGTDD